MLCDNYKTLFTTKHGGLCVSHDRRTSDAWSMSITKIAERRTKRVTNQYNVDTTGRADSLIDIDLYTPKCPEGQARSVSAYHADLKPCSIHCLECVEGGGTALSAVAAKFRSGHRNVTG